MTRDRDVTQDSVMWLASKIMELVAYVGSSTQKRVCILVFLGRRIDRAANSGHTQPPRERPFKTVLHGPGEEATSCLYNKVDIYDPESDDAS